MADLDKDLDKEDGGFYHHPTCQYGFPQENGGVGKKCTCGTVEKWKEVQCEIENLKMEIMGAIEMGELDEL